MSDLKGGLRYVYEADLVFLEVSTGVYCVAKDRDGLYKKGYYVSNREVAADMNLKSIKVVIAKEDIANVVTANFKLKSKEDVTNA